MNLSTKKVLLAGIAGALVAGGLVFAFHVSQFREAQTPEMDGELIERLISNDRLYKIDESGRLHLTRIPVPTAEPSRIMGRSIDPELFSEQFKELSIGSSGYRFNCLRDMQLSVEEEALELTGCPLPVSRYFLKEGNKTLAVVVSYPADYVREYVKQFGQLGETLFFDGVYAVFVDTELDTNDSPEVLSRKSECYSLLVRSLRK